MGKNKNITKQNKTKKNIFGFLNLVFIGNQTESMIGLPKLMTYSEFLRNIWRSGLIRVWFLNSETENK